MQGRNRHGEVCRVAAPTEFGIARIAPRHPERVGAFHRRYRTRLEQVEAPVAIGGFDVDRSSDEGFELER